MSEIFDLSDYDTLFLDRDGVINKYRQNDYVKTWEEFEFLPGVLEAFALLSKRFKHIFIVTNQRGVGKGLMSEATLLDIHERMVVEIEKNGGRIDKIYYCTDVNEDSPNRKPNIGMALQSRKDFPDLDFNRSLMVGDNTSDIEFGKRSGMNSIRLGSSNKKYNGLIDLTLYLIQ